MPKRIDIVATTIGDGGFLAPYADLVLATGAAERVRLLAIPDRRTPRAFYAAVEAACRRGVQVEAPGIAAQEDLLRSLGAGDFVPWNSDNRRNVGYLLAWMSDAEVVVSIDDDNLPVAGDMLERHAIVAAGPARREIVSCDSGWFNPCRMLQLDPPAVTAFARGFPYEQRGPEGGISTRVEEVTVRVNAGLWYGDPDVDAVTRLALRPRVEPAPVGSLVLDRGTWAPVNSQNTALHREALPAYWFVRMGQRLFGGVIDRFGDIFSGYFLQACAKHLGHGVRFGDPIADHRRNDHVVLEDLSAELPGIRALEPLAGWLRECRLEGGGYADAYRSLSHALDEAAEDSELTGAEPAARSFLHETASSMRRWLDLLTRAAA